jgi:26S proteasome regulatory subunit N5
VCSKKVSAKIDRPGGVVSFNPDSRGADWLLNQWLLDVLDKSNHLIHKEAMAHKVSLE